MNKSHAVTPGKWKRVAYKPCAIGIEPFSKPWKKRKKLRPAEFAVALVGRAAEQRHVSVGGDERIAHLLAAQHHGGAARPLEGIAVGIEAVGLPHAHADRGQAVGRDDRLDLVEVIAEVADGAPDV